VRYVGNDKRSFNNELYVVVLPNHLSWQEMKDDDNVVIHIVNKYDIITFNDEEKLQKIFTVKKSDLKIESVLVKK
jgi:hypothetical protein